jgi:hypothetical protein
MMPSTVVWALKVAVGRIQLETEAVPALHLGYDEGIAAMREQSGKGEAAA